MVKVATSYYINVILMVYSHMRSVFFKIFVGHMSICGATDTPVLDFWMSLLGFKANHGFKANSKLICLICTLAEVYVIYILS